MKISMSRMSRLLITREWWAEWGRMCGASLDRNDRLHPTPGGHTRLGIPTIYKHGAVARGSGPHTGVSDATALQSHLTNVKLIARMPEVPTPARRNWGKRDRQAEYTQLEYQQGIVRRRYRTGRFWPHVRARIGCLSLAAILIALPR